MAAALPLRGRVKQPLQQVVAALLSLRLGVVAVCLSVVAHGGENTMQILYDETERAAFEAIEGQPDRVVGIVAGSILENRVADLIKAVLRPDVKVWNEVFTGVGPAAPYSVKLKLAYLSKLIDKETFDDLNYIRKI